jgi:hypothetical protein
MTSDASISSRVITLRLNPAAPRERAILSHLGQMPKGEQSAEIKRLLYQALTPEPMEPTPDLPPAAHRPRLTYREKRKAWRPPDSPTPAHAAELIGLLSGGEMELLAVVAWHPYLTATDVAEWLNCSTSFTRSALSFLEHKGALQSQLKAVAHWPRARFYTLTHLGVLLVSQHEGKAPKEMSRMLGFGPNQPGFLEHSVEANRFFLALHAQKALGQLRVWHSEAGSRTRFKSAGRKQPSLLRPDGYGEWKTESGRYPFYLEWDRHTGNPQKVRDKLRLYQAYYTASQGQAEGQLVVPRLLFVACDDNRARLVWRIREQLHDAAPYGLLPLLVTHRDRVWQGHPLDAIWQAGPHCSPSGPWEDLGEL